MPASSETVTAYVDHLTEAPASPATIRQAVWAIGYMHRAAEEADPTKANRVGLALQRMSKQTVARQRQAAPLGDRQVQRILATAGGSLTSRRDVTLMLVMRDLLARRSEAVALNVEDVQAEDGGATVIIRKSKTDKTGEGATLWLGADAMEHLKGWMQAAQIEAGPIFRSINKAGRIGNPLTGGEVPRILKRLAVGAGIEAKHISGHSCRVGMAQDLVAAGAELPAVMQAGRWKSAAMPARYAERQQASRNAVARYHEKRGS
jgi:integrase